eukprot:TRINITY_DN95824_c0_g1_i1.p1 TRINITY_DN95824_c0_g1~~TRINITY_DN95824_c0_g1_i1.p1  ORF type:complete len:375 (+),score=65.05 TRINITY_DN95824_c0_g1_i1:41-1165(+)
MTQSIATPSPATSLRGYLARLWDDEESRSTLVGVVGVILFYLLLWLVSPYLFRVEPITASATRPHAAPRQFSIELAPDTFVKPPPKTPPPKQFVETNPDAPENIPDKTNNFAAQNQQVAQEKPTPDGKSEMPALEGKRDFQNTQIVSGQLSKPIEHVEATPPQEVTPPSEKMVQAPKLEQNPLQGFEKKEGENKDAFGTNIAKAAENNRPVPNRVEGVKNVPLIQDSVATQPAIDPLRPRPRPTVVKQQQVRPAILAENKFGTTNIGPTAVSALWSNYGAYLSRMIEAVQVQWEIFLGESKVYPAAGSTVTVKFIMDAKGQITKIVSHESTASDGATRACMSAITKPAPYGDWTDDMKAVLGEQQEMTFTFYYQ